MSIASKSTYLQELNAADAGLRLAKLVWFNNFRLAAARELAASPYFNFGDRQRIPLEQVRRVIRSRP